MNECGRTLQAGNIDIGASTEDALAADQVTQVTKGSSVQVTIREVNQTGAGPYTCDMDPTGNSIGATGQTNLTTTESKPDKNGDITLKVAMPKDLACIGCEYIPVPTFPDLITDKSHLASTGDVCTVRCRNANEFGGCFAVQQTDTTPAENTPQNIETAQTLQGITQQVQQNIADLPAAANALAGAGSSDAEIGTAIVEGIQATDPATDGLAQDQAGDANTGNSNTGNANTNTGNNNGNGRGGRGKNRGNNNRRRNVRRLR